MGGGGCTGKRKKLRRTTVVIYYHRSGSLFMEISCEFSRTCLALHLVGCAKPWAFQRKILAISLGKVGSA